METWSTMLYISYCLCSEKCRTLDTTNITECDVKYMQIWEKGDSTILTCGLSMGVDNILIVMWMDKKKKYFM